MNNLQLMQINANINMMNTANKMNNDIMSIKSKMIDDVNVKNDSNNIKDVNVNIKEKKNIIKTKRKTNDIKKTSSNDYKLDTYNNSNNSDNSQINEDSSEGNAISQLMFDTIKSELYYMVQDITSLFLGSRNYDENYAQDWSNTISDEIIKCLHQQQRGFKFICCTTIFQKGDSSLHFSSTCLWNPTGDGSVVVKYENPQMNCFVNLYGIAP